jgi:hypothetical protein
MTIYTSIGRFDKKYVASNFFSDLLPQKRPKNSVKICGLKSGFEIMLLALNEQKLNAFDQIRSWV